MRCFKSMRTQIAALLLSGAVLGAASAVAQPVIREQLDIEGDFALIGSTLVYDCGSLDLGLVRLGKIAGDDNCLNLNINAPDAFWRADYPEVGDALASTEFTSDNARTVATLQLPQGAVIVYARLYWAGYRSADEAGVDTAVRIERVASEGPGLDLNERVQPQDIQSKPQPGTRDRYYYQASADITKIVKEVGVGTFRVGSFKSEVSDILGVLQGGVASWHMVVFYELAGQPPRNLTLFEGLEYIDRDSPHTFALDGFIVPSNAGFEAHMAIVAYDGQDEFEGDSLTCNGVALGNALNPASNFFNATRSRFGRTESREGDLPRLSGEPGSYTNVDFDVVDITTLVEAGDTSAELIASAGNGPEVFLLGGFVTSISTLAPDFSRSLKTAVDLNGGLTLPGDTVEYTIAAENTGSDTANDARIVDVLPEGVTFVPGSIRLVAGTDAVSSFSDQVDDDRGQYDAESRTVTVWIGRGAGPRRGGSLDPGEKAVITFQVTIDEDTRGTVENQGSVIAVGEKGAPETETPTDGEPDNEGQDPTVIEVNGCETDSDCPDSAPICDTSVSPQECVGCITDSQCTDEAEPDCDPDSQTCYCPDGAGNCQDSDMDGASDGTEEMNGTDPMDADSDDDGALDGEEVRPGEDFDGDGLINGLDPDSDNDGLFDGTELGNDCMHPQTDRSRKSCRPDKDPTTVTGMVDADSDGGGVIDGSEDFNFDGKVDRGETDPLVAADDGDVADEDRDGLSDGFEATVHSDPEDQDSDDDGSLDGAEANPSHDGDLDGLVSVVDPDSDDDALFDGTESGQNCSHPDTHRRLGHCIPDGDRGETKTSPVAADTDNGGVRDGSEDFDLDGVIDAGETDPTAGHGADDGMVVDRDGDGLSDGLEVTLGSDINDEDSDDDGLLDGEENNPSDDTDRDGRRNVKDVDSDGDRIPDGKERGTDCSDADTDPNVCEPDADNGEETTSAVNPDTDFGGTWDGVEDENRNGRIDDGETDPNDPSDDVGCSGDSHCGEEDDGSICVMGACVQGCRDEPGSGCPPGQTCSIDADDEEDIGECVGTLPPSPIKMGGRYGGGGFACAVRPQSSSAVGALLVAALLSLVWAARRRRRK